MPDRVEHCPFLNRSDARCSENFSIDHLQHAFKFCFGRYKACSAYAELLVERRIRRGETAEQPSMTGTTHANRIVQITLPARHARPVAGRAGVPAASGV